MKNSYSPDKFFNEIYSAHKSPFENAESKTECISVCEEVSEELEKALAIEKIPNKCGNLNPVKIKSEKHF